MQIGMIGLGRMGPNMVRRLIRKGHSCVVFNRSPQPVNELVKENAIGATSLADVVKKLTRPRATRPEPGITAGKLMQRYTSVAGLTRCARRRSELLHRTSPVAIRPVATKNVYELSEC